MGLMLMNHETDPKQDINDKVKDYLDEIPVYGARVLVAIYKRPEKTSGGIILTDNTRQEDIWQGKVGLILKMGALPMDDDDKKYFGDHIPQVGDWVAVRPSDGWPVSIATGTKNPQECRLLEDRRAIKMVLSRPDIIW